MSQTTETHHRTARGGLGAHHAGSASVAIDIGPGRGALVIYPAERFRGTEIEISRADGDARRQHTGVHARPTQGGEVLTAIFGSLPAGDYVLDEHALATGQRVTVRAGAVTEMRLE